MKEHLSTKLMKENFMRLHNEGKTIPEIADTYKISVYTVYDNLQDIADNNGVTRDSLLTRVHKKHEFTNVRTTTDYEPINQTELLKNFDDINKSISNILNTISNVLEATT